MSPKRASSKAITFSGFFLSGGSAVGSPVGSASHSRPILLSSPRNFFEGLLLFRVGLLVAGPPRLELHLGPPQQTPDALGVGVVDASLKKEPMRLGNRGYLA